MIESHIGIFLIPLLFLSCASDYGSVEIFLKRSPLVTEDPLDSSLVTHIRVRVTGPDMEPREEMSAFEPGGSSSVPRVPVGEDRVITVESLAGEDGYAVSRGRSLPVKILGGNQKIELFVARVGGFSIAPGYGLKQARFAHTTMLSERGELFLIGGATAGTRQDPEGLLSSIEIYDPTSGDTNYFSCGGSSGDLCLKAPRANVSGVTIEDGILLLGGVGAEGLSSSIELLDTDNKETEEKGLICGKRSDAVVLSLAGASLVAGGRDSSGRAVDLVELVSLAGEIEQLSLPKPKWGMAAARSLSKGFFFGGFDDSDDVSSEFFLFDPSAKKFSSHKSNVKARAWAGAVSMSDGRVLVLGGLDENGEASRSVDLFDPKPAVLCNIGELQRGRWLASTVRLPDGRALIIGGLTSKDPDEPTAEVEMLDPRFVKIGENCNQISGQLSTYRDRVQNMRVRRYASSAILLPNGVVAVSGGLDEQGRPIKQIEIFVPEK